jgi:hypothetical protein
MRCLRSYLSHQYKKEGRGRPRPDAFTLEVATAD